MDWYLKKCQFCIGNDTGFAHLSVNLDIETLIIHGDCPPQSYSKLLKHVDIEPYVTRSSTSIHTIKIEKVLDELSKLLNRRGLNAYKKGIMSIETFATNLSKEWASLPKDASGISYYAGVSNNKAHTSWDNVIQAIKNTYG